MAFTEVQQGIAKIFGMDGADLAVGAASTATSQTMDDADLEGGSTIDEVIGQNGEVETLISSNATRTLTINFAPNAATRAAAITEAEKFSALGQIVKVTTSGFSIAEYNGAWNLMGWSGKLTKAGVYMMTLRLKAFITNRTSLTAGVIAT